MVVQKVLKAQTTSFGALECWVLGKSIVFICVKRLVDSVPQRLSALIVISCGLIKTHVAARSAARLISRRGVLTEDSPV